MSSHAIHNGSYVCMTMWVVAGHLIAADGTPAISTCGAREFATSSLAPGQLDMLGIQSALPGSALQCMLHVVSKWQHLSGTESK